MLTVAHARLQNELAVEEEDSSFEQLKIQLFNALKQKWGLAELDASQIPLLSTTVDPRYF